MLTETGRVVAVEDDGLWVETVRRSTCGDCSASKGCGHGLLNQIGEGHRHLIRVMLGGENPDRYRVDQSVRIGIPEELLLRSSIVVYALPLLCLLLGAVALPVLMNDGSHDLVAVAGAVLGLAGGVALVRWHAGNHRDDPDLQPRLLGPVETSPGEAAGVQIQG